MGQQRLRLVIDASVTTASGLTNHPVSSRCRHLLQTVFTVCHCVVVTPHILKEWDEHSSRFAIWWRGAMTRHAKTVFLDLPPECDLSYAMGEPGVMDAGLAREIRKDLPLIEAALAADMVIVSLDEAARGHICRYVLPKCAQLAGIAWVHPVQDHELLILCLQGALPISELPTLGGVPHQ